MAFYQSSVLKMISLHDIQRLSGMSPQLHLCAASRKLLQASSIPLKFWSMRGMAFYQSSVLKMTSLHDIKDSSGMSPQLHLCAASRKLLLASSIPLKFWSMRGMAFYQSSVLKMTSLHDIKDSSGMSPQLHLCAASRKLLLASSIPLKFWSIRGMAFYQSSVLKMTSLHDIKDSSGMSPQLHLCAASRKLLQASSIPLKFWSMRGMAFYQSSVLKMSSLHDIKDSSGMSPQLHLCAASRKLLHG